MPSLDRELLTAEGKPGWVLTVHNNEADDRLKAIETPIETYEIQGSALILPCSTPFRRRSGNGWRGDG